MSSSRPNSEPITEFHTQALALLAAGNVDGAIAQLRRVAREASTATVLNDLAVMLAGAGDADGALTLLRGSLEVEPGHQDARDNLAQLIRSDATDIGTWRHSKTLGGADVTLPERAYPGMPNSVTMSNHAMRYALALGPVGGCHALDVGCGTGYGSEMLTWTAASVRGFDLWQPKAYEHPHWPGGAELHYGFNVCTERLPSADVAVMFEITEHLHDAPAALRNVFGAVSALVVSFPNPTYHGSHLNHHHVNDWTLDRFEEELRAASRERFAGLEITHLHQALGTPLLMPGRNPEAAFWVALAVGLEPRTDMGAGRL